MQCFMGSENKTKQSLSEGSTISEEAPDDDLEQALSTAVRAPFVRCCLAFKASSSS